MIFDFRLRPPYKGFCDLSIFNPVCNSVSPHNVNARHTASAHEKSMALFMEEMQEAGIGKGVVMARAASNWAASVPNEDVRSLALEYPDTFIPFGGVNVSCGIASALKEVEKCVQWGFRGISMEPGFFEPARKADDATLYPVYARCEELNLPVVLTCSFAVGPDLEFSNPVAVQHVAVDFPNLQIVIAHASYPWVLHAANVAVLHPNIWLLPDMYMHNPSSPGNQLYSDVVRWLDGERILFGSAYPCYDMRQAVRDLERFHFSAEHMDKLLYKNAEKLLTR